MADVFDAEVLQLETGNSAALGAAIRAFHADRLASGKQIEWEDAIAGFVVPRPDSRLTPIAAHAEVYRKLTTRYAELELQSLKR
jgi:sugar (pentulose or hexulose) kinase